MASTERQRWARVPPHLAWKHPGLPATWTRVLKRNPEAMDPAYGPGTVWYKIKSRTYTQWEGRWELFQNRRP